MAVLKKLVGPLALVLVGIVAGSFGTLKLQKPPEYKCPDCNCPEPTVSVQPFDVDKIKGLRSFVYTPQFSGSIRVAGVDSTALRKMIDASMEKAMQKYMPDQHSKRRRASLTPEEIERIARRARYRTDNRFTKLFQEADEAFDR